MRISPVVPTVAMALTVVGCATVLPAPAPSGSPAPASIEPPLPTSGELYLVTYLDDAGPSFGVRVDAIGPTGRTRPIATIDDARPAGWDDASPSPILQPTVGPTGLLALGVERNGGEGDDAVRTLLVDVTGAGRPTVTVHQALFDPVWGPAGGLLALEPEPIAIDSRSGGVSQLLLPEGIELPGMWLADGTGWVATRRSGEKTVAGGLSRDGKFIPGRVESFEITGLERYVGADGGTLSMAVSDGVGQSDSAIIELRPDLAPPCSCVAWARFTTPGMDPQFGDRAVWDAAGRGLWLVYSDGTRRWLSKLDKPLHETKVADLPPNMSWQIVGISADDRWVVLNRDDIGTGSLLIVDTATGDARVLAESQASGPTPTFAGWVR